MREENYEGLDAGERWGCGVSGLLGAVCFMFLLSLDALGDCAPDTRCTKGFLTNVLLPTLLLTAAVFFGLRWLVSARRR